MLLEVCVDSLAGLRAAEAGGAGRIELCSRLDLGGLSPGLELLEGALEAAALPLHVMVRTRPGGFVHPEAEIAAMEAEVRALRARGDLHAELPAMRCVGYRQVWQYLEQKCDLATLRERAIVATRQLAKRQLTWLRAMQGIEGFDCLEVDVDAKVLRFVDRRLTERAPGLRQDRNA